MEGRPPAGGFGAPGGNAPVQYSPNPPPPPSRWNLARLSRIFILVTGLPCLALVVAVGVSSCLDKKRDLVVFDNQLDAPAEVIVDGQLVQTIKPRSTFWIHPVVKLPEGAKHITVRANGVVVSETNVSIPPRQGDQQGYRGLYVIGPTREYAIVKMPYFSDDGPHVETFSIGPVPTPDPLVELPRELTSSQISSINGPFSRSESMPKGAKVYWKVQLCTLDRRTNALGCSGAPQLVTD